MNDITKLRVGDVVTIDTDAFSGSTLEVSDVEVEDIGITETVAVALVNDDTLYSIVGTTADSLFTITNKETEEQFRMMASDITVV